MLRPHKKIFLMALVRFSHVSVGPGNGHVQGKPWPLIGAHLVGAGRTARPVPL